MEINNNKNIFLYTDSNSQQSCYSYNIDENEINNRYKNLELKMEESDIDNKEEKYQKYYNSRKKYIFNKNYGKKISLFTQSNQDTSNKSKSKSKRNLIHKKNIEHNCFNKETDELTLEQYIEELKKKYDEDPIYFENMDKINNIYYYRFSFCFFCHHPAFAYRDEVSCINKCFNMKIRTNEFSENYTLDNFLESHFEFCSNHMECNGDIIPLFINEKTKEPFFICTNCDNKILEKIGIKL